MNISISSSRYGITGLVGTIISLLRHAAAPEAHTVHVLCCRWLESDKKLFLKAMQKHGGNIILIDINDAEEFENWPSFFGDWSTYTRLLAPKLVTASKLLHLDADLLIKFDVGEFDTYNLSATPLAAVSAGTTIKHSNDRNFLTQATDLVETDRYFNAGVILYNVDIWRENNLSKKVSDFGNKHAQAIPVADQSILNGLFSKDFVELGAEFNVPWYPESAGPSMDLARVKILHFVGAPKPWDPFGSILHSGYKDWKKATDGKVFLNFGGTISRAMQIRRSIARTVLRKLKTSKNSAS